MKLRLCRTRCRWLLLAAATVGTTAGAQVIQQYPYQPDAVYEVNAGLGITTQVVLGPDERVLEYSTGFSNGWDISRRGTVFYLRPRNVDVDTDMIIRTEARSYLLELRVVATDWKTLAQAKGRGVRYRIMFTYPDAVTPEAAQSAPRVGAAPVADGPPAGQRNFDYDYAAGARTPAWLIPASVHDDGSFTYVTMRDSSRYPTGNFPAVFMRQTEHGPDATVNTTIRDDTIVVHGTYPYLVIRQGIDVVGIRRRPRP